MKHGPYTGALANGPAREELEAISTTLPEYCDVDAAQVKALATKMLERYKSQGLASDPVAIVIQGKHAMMRLSGRQRRNAIKLAARVAAASPGGEASEASFLRQIEQIARA